MNINAAVNSTYLKLYLACTEISRIKCIFHSLGCWRNSSSSSLSSSLLAQQPLLSQGLLQKLLPAVPIPCSIPPISLPQLPGIFHHTIFPPQFQPASLSSSFYHCNENSSCRDLFRHTNNMSCPFKQLILMYGWRNYIFLLAIWNQKEVKMTWTHIRFSNEGKCLRIKQI